MPKKIAASNQVEQTAAERNVSEKNQRIGSAASRRNFFKDSGLLLAGGALVGGQLAVARSAHAFAAESIRLGLVGCGGRGTGAIIQALATTGGDVRLTAMADVFQSNLQSAYRAIKGKYPQQVDVAAESRFVGLDAYQKLFESDVDVVFLATPPGFRPLHFERAIAAGKHVFMEKPVAVDAPGVRRVLATGQIATAKGLAVQVGLHRRHETRYRQCVARLHDGIIGEPIFARAYWNGSGVWTRPRRPSQTELEYQINNWYYFNWLSGDHITEQHIHNLDIINWVMNGFPVEAQGQGGRQVRSGASAGEIYDHHMIEYTYSGGTRMLSQCRQIAGCWSKVGEHVQATGGSCDISSAKIFDRRGRLIWESAAKEVAGNGWQQEQIDFFAAIRAGQTPNETEYAAHSTLTAIMGRMASYSGKVITWNQALSSNLSLADVETLHTLDSPAPVRPLASGAYEIATPGKTIAT
ncbi:MAG TPA: oxidoreductase [Planctomycetaceae bacterium]|nr:oxidoreductase [Planctomycetaceae bacterium]